MKKFILITIILFSSVQLALTQTLKASYYFNSNTNDSSGNNFHLAANDIRYTTDRFNKANTAIRFNGANPKLELLNANALKLSSFTVSVWIRLIEHPAERSYQTIYCLGDNKMDHGFSVANKYLNIYSGFSVYSYTTESQNANASSVVLPELNKWYQLCAVRDDKSINFYLNGNWIGEGTATGAPGYSSNISLWLGSRYGNSQLFSGIIDDFMLYEGVMDDAQVASLYSVQNNVKSIDNSIADFLVYPNPSTGKIYINNLNPENQEVLSLNIYDLQGKLLHKQEVLNNLDEVTLDEIGRAHV